MQIADVRYRQYASGIKDDRLRAKIPLADGDYAAILLYDDAQLDKHSTLQTQKLHSTLQTQKLTVSCKTYPRSCLCKVTYCRSHQQNLRHVYPGIPFYVRDLTTQYRCVPYQRCLGKKQCFGSRFIDYGYGSSILR